MSSSRDGNVAIASTSAAETARSPITPPLTARMRDVRTKSLTAFADCTALRRKDQRGRTLEQRIEPDHAGISGSDAGQRVLGTWNLGP